MARRSIDPRTQQVLLVAAGVEAGLKLAAIIDLAQRPAAEIRGSKPAWIAAVLALNSAGVLPIAYFLRGRLR